jgi:hypothetical protein
VKELGLIIDINQSSASSEGAVKKSVLDFYLPLFRVLKLYKNVNFSLSIPLSTLELWDKYGHTELISDIKDLYQNDRVEIVMSSPYGLSLPNVSKDVIEKIVMLNEYGVGYYLGSRKGFEGESSVMLRDSNGFLPYGLSVSEDVIKVLGDYGYKWVALRGEELVGSVGNIFEIEGEDILGVNVTGGNEVLFGNLTDGNSFEGSGSAKSGRIRDFFSRVSGNGSFGNVFVGFGDFDCFENEDLDYKDIVNTVELFLDEVISQGYVVKSVGDIVKSKNRLESYSIEQIDKSYHLFSSYKFKSKKLQDGFNSISRIMTDKMSYFTNNSIKDDFDTIRLWNSEDLNKLNDSDIQQYSSILVCFSKILSFLMYLDVYHVVSDLEGQDAYHDNTSQYLNYIKEILSYILDDSLKGELSDIINNSLS